MTVADSIIAAMKAEIENKNLELLKHHPNDLLVHDRKTLEDFAVPGAQIAWVVGHLHSHLAILGLTTRQNRMTSHLTNLAEEDRFYHLTMRAGGFTMKEKRARNSPDSPAPGSSTRARERARHSGLSAATSASARSASKASARIFSRITASPSGRSAVSARWTVPPCRHGPQTPWSRRPARYSSARRSSGRMPSPRRRT